MVQAYIFFILATVYIAAATQIRKPAQPSQPARITPGSSGPGPAATP
jgi:hypothetical protein